MEETPESPPTTEENPQEGQPEPPLRGQIALTIVAAAWSGYSLISDDLKALLCSHQEIEPVLARAAELLTGRAVKTLLVEFADEESDGPDPA